MKIRFYYYSYYVKSIAIVIIDLVEYIKFSDNTLFGSTEMAEGMTEEENGVGAIGGYMREGKKGEFERENERKTRAVWRETSEYGKLVLKPS